MKQKKLGTVQPTKASELTFSAVAYRPVDDLAKRSLVLAYMCIGKYTY